MDVDVDVDVDSASAIDDETVTPVADGIGAAGSASSGMEPITVEVASGTVSQLGESPRWDVERGSLWWVDITGSVLHELHEDGTTVTRRLARHAGTVMLADDGRLLLATTAGLELLDPDVSGGGAGVAAGAGAGAAAGPDAIAVSAAGDPDAIVVEGRPATDSAVVSGALVCPIESDAPGRRMNDASVDPSGRVYAGTMRWHDAGAQPHDGVLYLIDGCAPAVPVLTELGCPNGLVWPNPGLLVYIDSMTRSIALWSVDPATGALREQTGSIDVSMFDGVPDGMTLDADGALWVAFWGGGVVRRFALDGTVLATIDVPTPLVTSVAFGGPDLATLYITTASPDPDPEPASGSDSAAAGLLYRCVPGQHGLLPDRWPASA